MSSFKRKNVCLFANLHQEYNIKDFSEDELEEDDDVVEEEELGVVYFDKFPFSIPNKVPIKLDLEKHNYNSWSSFSIIHLVVTTPGNAKALWDHLKDLFHDNKDVRAINLDNELCSIKIGKMTVNEYCTRIKSMANTLKNLDCQVSEKNLVIYAVNGLDSRFATLVEIIRHREPLPIFETVRNMLLLKESSFNDDSGATTNFESSSSSPPVLVASNSSNNKVNSNKSPSLPQICNHFNKGSCKFGDRCKFIHDHQNRSGLSGRNNGIGNFGTRNNRTSVSHSYVQTQPD
ncbi:hybrid signal transduction histidine kinase M [Tanacetum coccineum]